MKEGRRSAAAWWGTVELLGWAALRFPGLGRLLGRVRVGPVGLPREREGGKRVGLGSGRECGLGRTRDEETGRLERRGKDRAGCAAGLGKWAGVLDWAEVLGFFSPFYFLFLFKPNSNYLNSKP